MLARDIMTKSVVTISPAASLVDAGRLMLDQRISGIPVVNAEGALEGVLSEGDLLRRCEMGTEKSRTKWQAFLCGPSRAAKDYVRSHGRRVDELMTRDVVTVGEDTPLDDVVQLMETRRVRRVPVVKDNKVVGIITRADLLRTLVRELGMHVQPAPGDAALRDQILAEIRSHDWGARNDVTVLVTDGVVYLEGIYFDEREHTAIVVAAENAAGTREVKDHLAYFDVNAGMAIGM